MNADRNRLRHPLCVSASLRLGGIALCATLVLLAVAPVVAAQRPAFTAYRASGIYEVGETVGWRVSHAAGRLDYVVKKNNHTVIKAGKLDLSSPRAVIETTLDEPGMVYVEVSWRGETVALGAAVSPEKLRPSVARPPDFDRFWAEKIAALEAVPENAVLTPKESGNPSVEYATIKMANVDGASIHGQLAKPRRTGKFPALLLLQWASPPYPLQKAWVTDRAAEGWLTLNVQPHDVLPDAPQAYYDALPETLKKYELIGQADRDRSHFLRMYLGDYRAVEYLASRPDWDGKTLVVMGTSMGGQQSLCVAGLNPKVTHVIVNEPAGCDTNGTLHGRTSGYPNWPSDDPAVMRTALYFDAVNFASRIEVPALVAIGFVDTVTPPVGIWIAFNEIRGPKEAVPMVDSPHNHLATPEQQRPYTERSAALLAAILRGERVMPQEL